MKTSGTKPTNSLSTVNSSGTKPNNSKSTAAKETLLPFTDQALILEEEEER